MSDWLAEQDLPKTCSLAVYRNDDHVDMEQSLKGKITIKTCHKHQTPDGSFTVCVEFRTAQERPGQR